MTIARNIARAVGSSVRAGRIGPEGGITGQFSATIYDSTVSLPTTGVSAGAQAYVSSNQRLYIRGTGGWYNIATINNNPTINSIQTAGGDSSPFTLAADGTTTTVITITATDSEGFPITFSAVADAGFDSIATVTNDSSVFTITPFSQDSAGTATSGTLTFKASDGVNIASEVATFTLTFEITNSNFTSTLIKASGNNGTNVTINDESTNNHTITIGGNAAAQAFTPYHPGGYSTYFDGSADYLQVASSSDFAFGSNDFTIEFWAYPKAITIAALLDPRTTNSQAVPWIGLRDTGYFYYYVSGANRIEGTAGSVTTNKWYHVAVSRSSGTTKMFVNGTQIGSDYSDSTSYVQGGPWRTGTRYNGTTLPYNGYIKDFRCINGTGLYTTNFTSPTEPLTAVANTKLLHSHLPYFDDGSSSNHSVTISGNTKTERFGPYDYLNYNASSHGASVYFDGSGDFLSIPDTATTEFGSGDFTLEMWYNGADTDQYATLTAKGAGSFTSGNWALMMNHSATGDIALYVGDYSTGAPMLITSDVGIDNQWNHIAVVRNGNNWNLYVNGVSKASRTSSITIADTSSGVYIGKDQYYGRDLSGFISDYRIVKGTAVYTSNFTPPTVPLTAISGTSYLTCNDASNVFNATGIDSPLKLYGNAKSSTAQTKNASSSIAFDGTGDYLSLSDDASLQMGSEDFSIEAWVYVNAHKNTNYIYSYSFPYQFTIDSNGHLESYFNDGDNFNSYIIVQGSTAIPTSTWTHVAVVRNGNTFRQFVNGIQDGTTTSSATLATPSAYDPTIGNWGGGSYSFNGYLEDLRITKSLSRYPFILPRKTLTSSDQDNTKLIACHASTATTDGAGLQTITANGTPLVNQAGPHAGMLSVYFDGSNEALRTSDNSSLSMGTGDFNIEAWIKPDNTSSAYRAIISDNLYGSAGSWCIYQYGTKLYIASDGNAISTLGGSGNTLLSAGTWSHIAFTRASGTARLFHNGIQVGSDTSLTTDFTDDQILIGANNHAGGYPNYDFIGYISNVRVIKGTAIYNKSFTPPTSELKA